MYIVPNCSLVECLYIPDMLNVDKTCENISVWEDYLEFLILMVFSLD